VCFIQLRNPWGQCEWLGDWRDQDPRWTEELKTEMEHDIEPDGTFCMAWNDFVVWFGEVQISDPVCLQHATEGDTAQVDVFHSAMVAGKTAGGPRGGRTFHFNPSVGLTVTKDCDVYLSLYQPDTRSYGQDEDGYQLDGQQLALTLTDPIHTHVQTEVMHLSPYERLTCCKIKCDAGKTYKLTVKNPDGTPVPLGPGSAVYLARAYGPGGPGPVVHHHGGAPQVGELLGEDPGNVVAIATCGIRHDQRDGTAGVVDLVCMQRRDQEQQA
jgi:hypothetical protein